MARARSEMAVLVGIVVRPGGLSLAAIARDEQKTHARLEIQSAA